MPETKKSLVTKLSEIMASVERIPKNGTNKFHGYKYATEADVSDHCRELMAERHVIMTADVEEQTQLIIGAEGKQHDICRLHIRYTFYDGDSHDVITFRMVSDGQDNQDKGPYKAITGGVKYALMKTFLIPTGDDPERDNPQDGQTTSSQTSSTATSNAPTEKQRKAIYAKAKANDVSDDNIPGLLGAMIGRKIESSKELTKTDAHKILDIMGDQVEMSKYWPPKQTTQDEPPDYSDADIPF